MFRSQKHWLFHLSGRLTTELFCKVLLKLNGLNPTPCSTLSIFKCFWGKKPLAQKYSIQESVGCLHLCCSLHNFCTTRFPPFLVHFGSSFSKPFRTWKIVFDSFPFPALQILEVFRACGFRREVSPGPFGWVASCPSLQASFCLFLACLCSLFGKSMS